ncbi:hypothetical protein FE257_011021 [Aspergillus nanangensis]|uniref:Uncharacterized protein n=1 Tax=Aspergillus nanangensis TaxID=2582783 RepID=A0AAD4CIM4_ASPNN|nr:hypothetical protein FE257_011021 [Aspergillus nanangensis]
MSSNEATPEPQVGYADPELHYPKIRLVDLPDPPEDWRFLNETVYRCYRNRRLRRPEVEQAVRFYSWGIDVDMNHMNITRGLQWLWKIFYNQETYHWPTSYEHLMDFANRDAGPRLFSCSINVPNFLPISRYYPQPPSRMAPTRANYVRPDNAAAAIPDSYIQKMQYPAWGEPIADPDDVPGTLYEEAVQIGQIPEFNHKTREIIEAVERAVMCFAQPDLERHHTAAPREPRAHLTAVNLADLSKSLIGSFSATATVKLNRDYNPMAFDPDGSEYPYRGRGPAGRNNSTPLDCVIVAGKLLDAGSTVIDRSSPIWREIFSPVEQAFIEATDINWDTCHTANNYAMRDRLWELIAETTAEVQVGLNSPVWSIWNACTSNFSQFLSTIHEETVYCDCQSRPTLRVPHKTYTMFMLTATPDQDNSTSVPLQTAISRCFAPLTLSDCEACGEEDAVGHRKVVKNLPPRLVVSLDGTDRIQKHTRDIEFEYVDEEDQHHTAHYRWLGGIYQNIEGESRLYWTDTERGVADNSEMVMYDSTNLGMIVGGIAQSHRDDKVPESWWKNRPVPLLFYELIDNPCPAVLNLALHTVCNMVKADRNSENILQNVSWRRPGVITERHEPWPPHLPQLGPRFHVADMEYMPLDFPELPVVPPLPPVGPIAYVAEPSLPAIMNNPSFPSQLMNPGFAVPVYDAPNAGQDTGPPGHDNSGLPENADLNEFMARYTFDPNEAEEGTPPRYVFFPSPRQGTRTLPAAGGAGGHESSDEEMAFASCSPRRGYTRITPAKVGDGGRIETRSRVIRARAQGFTKKKVGYPLVRAATLARARRAQNRKSSG